MANILYERSKGTCFAGERCLLCQRKVLAFKSKGLYLADEAPAFRLRKAALGNTKKKTFSFDISLVCTTFAKEIAKSWKSSIYPTATASLDNILWR